MPNHWSLGLASTGHSKRSRSAMSHWLTTTAYGSRTIVDTRSLLLVDDSIDNNVLTAGRYRLEQPHVATNHHFDENPRVIIHIAHLAPADNEVERAL